MSPAGAAGLANRSAILTGLPVTVGLMTALLTGLLMATLPLLLSRLLLPAMLLAGLVRLVLLARLLVRVLLVRIIHFAYSLHDERRQHQRPGM